MEIYTIGYEGLTIDAFIELLRDDEIKQVIDVRAVPVSRKPFFSKTALSRRLKLSGVEYTHMPQLGCPSDIRKRYKDDRNWTLYQQDFCRFLDTKEDALTELVSLCSDARSALLCFEKDHRFCHRSLITATLTSNYNISAIHISSTGSRPKTYQTNFPAEVR